MTRRLAPLSAEDVGQLPPPCATCLTWEVGPAAARRPPADPAAVKADWFSRVAADWGPPGLRLLVDGGFAGYALYAPPGAVPGAAAFPTSPPAPGSVLLLTVRVRPDLVGQGLGKVLVHGIARDLSRRKVPALEAFGAASGAPACVLPVGFLEAVGFVVVRPHPRWPRLRLDLQAAVGWRAEVEAAWGRLLGAVRPDPAPSPV